MAAAAAVELVGNRSRCFGAQRSGQLSINVAVKRLKRLAVLWVRHTRRITIDPRHNVFVLTTHFESHARFDLHLSDVFT